MKEEGTEDVIYLSDIVNYVKGIGIVLYNHKFLILGCFVLAILLSGAFAMQQPQQYNSSVIIKLGNVSDPIYENGFIVSRVLASDEYIVKTMEKENFGNDPLLVNSIKNNLKISPLTPDFSIFELSYISNDKNNATRFIKSLTTVLINDTEAYHIRYKNQISEEYTEKQNQIIELDNDINATRNSLRVLDTTPGISQLQLELSHSRTLDSLNSMMTRKSNLTSNLQDLKIRLEVMENTKIVVVTSDVQEKKSSKVMTILIAGIIGLLIGVFVAFVRELKKSVNIK